MHLFDDTQTYVTSCYPAYDALNENPKGAFTTFDGLIITNYEQNIFIIFEMSNIKTIICTGWCSTRLAGVGKNVRPESSKGWGFCSTDPSQDNCNGHIEPKVSTGDHGITN